MVQTIQQSFIHEGVEEIHLLRSVLKHITDNVFDHGLSQFHIVFQIRESAFRLDHPEFRSMTGRVGIFRTEGRTEGVDVAESLGKGFAVQLAAHRKIGRFPEEILREVHLSLFIDRNIRKIHRSHLEHLSGSFTVTACDQRRMHIHKSSLLEEFMDRISAERTDPEGRLERVCSGTKMGDRPEEFQRMTLFLKGIIRCGCSFYLDTLRLDLKGLFCIRRRHQCTADNDRSPYIQVGNLRKVVHRVMIDDLQGIKTGTIVKCDESERFGSTDTADPASDPDCLIQVFFSVSEYLFYGYQVHFLVTSYS